MENKKSKIFYGWFVVLGCIIITTTMVPPIMSLSNKFLIQVTTDMNISRGSFTLANTILQGLGIIISPMVAKKLAGGNMKKIQSISIIGFVLSYASYALAQSPIHLYISAFFVGIFYLNSTLIPVSMMVTNWFVKKRGLAMSLAMAGIGLGGTIFSPIVTMLLTNYGWRLTYVIMAGIILVCALPTSLFILRKSPAEMGLEPYGAGESVASTSANKVEKGVKISVKESKGKLFFWVMIAGMVANGLINSGALGQFPPALEELHGVATQAAIISMYSSIGIFGKILLGWVNDKFGIVISCTFGCVMFGLAFVFMLLGQNVNMLYAMAVVFGLGNAIGTVVPPLVTAEIFGNEKYGEAYGMVNSATQVGLSLGSLMVASLYDLNGSYTTAWIILLGLTVVTLVGWLGSYALSKKFCGNKAERASEIKVG